MTSLVNYGNTAVQRREDRLLDRAVGRISARTDVAIAEVNGLTEFQDSKIQAFTLLVGHAAKGAAQLGQLENQLAEMVPGSAARVGFIIDRGVLGLAGVVDDSLSALRRTRW